MQCCNIHVIIYSSAHVLEFIRAIRSFISIDSQTLNSYGETNHSLSQVKELELFTQNIDEMFEFLGKRFSSKPPE